jgi:oxygen-independent coproporphyrinogen-3 oxidase
MGLRLGEGVDLAALAARLNLPQDSLIDAEKARFYGDLGLVTRKGERLIVTPQGMPLLDALLGELVPADLVAA